MTAVADVLADRTWRWRDEVDLHESIAAVLDEAGLPFEREVRLSPRDRIDFMVGDVGLEVKVAATTDAVYRQLRRYAAHSEVTSLVLFTACAHHLQLPPTVRSADRARTVALEVVNPRWV